MCRLLLLLGRGAESAIHRLLLHPAKGVEWVCAVEPWLVGVHHATHGRLHASHRLLHASHLLVVHHWLLVLLRHHGLEPRRRLLLLLTVEVVILHSSVAHQPGEGVLPRQLLLSVELGTAL